MTATRESALRGAEGRRQRSYTMDSDLDREALLRHNLRVLRDQGTSARDTAILLQLPTAAVEAAWDNQDNLDYSPERGGRSPTGEVLSASGGRRGGGRNGREAEMAARKNVRKSTRQEPVTVQIAGIECRVWTRGGGQLSLRRMDLDKAASFWPRTKSDDLREQFLNAAVRAGFDAEDATAAARNLTFTR